MINGIQLGYASRNVGIPTPLLSTPYLSRILSIGDNDED